MHSAAADQNQGSPYFSTTPTSSRSTPIGQTDEGLASIGWPDRTLGTRAMAHEGKRKPKTDA